MTKDARQAGSLPRFNEKRKDSRTSLLVLALAVCAATPTRAEKLQARYALNLMGLSIGSVFASGEINREKYRLDISMKTTGLANLVNNTKGAATASGRLAQEGPAPAAFANTLANQWETRTVRMSLAGNAVRDLEVKPTPWDAAARVPLSETHKQHVLDPVSALIMSVPSGQPLVGSTACNRTIAVFDGVTRFDVRLAYVETRAVKTKGYEGPVSVCSARYTPIAGYRPDSSSTKFMAENREIRVWLAPLEESHVVAPLRIDLKTTIGTMTIDATEFLVSRRQASSFGQ